MQISSNLHSNVSRSTRINSSSVHTYIFHLFYLRVILQGFVTQNATESMDANCVTRSWIVHHQLTAHHRETHSILYCNECNKAFNNPTSLVRLLTNTKNHASTALVVSPSPSLFNCSRTLQCIADMLLTIASIPVV